MLFWTMNSSWLGCFDQRLRKLTQETVKYPGWQKKGWRARPEKWWEVQAEHQRLREARAQRWEGQMWVTKHSRGTALVRTGVMQGREAGTGCSAPAKQAGRDSPGDQRQDPRKCRFRGLQPSSRRIIGWWQEEKLQWIKTTEKGKYDKDLNQRGLGRGKKIRTGRAKTGGSKVTEARRNPVGHGKPERSNYLHPRSNAQCVLRAFPVQQKNLPGFTEPLSSGVEKKDTGVCVFISLWLLYTTHLILKSCLQISYF